MSITENHNGRIPLISQDLILVGLSCTTNEEVIRRLGELLHQQGYVTDGFLAAVLQREREYPTGLPTEIPVAIPHTDSTFCLQSAVAVALLREPVKFGFMADPEQTLPVRIAFLLAMVEPSLQVKWLKALVDFLRKPGTLQELSALETGEQVAMMLKERLSLPVDENNNQSDKNEKGNLS